MSLQELPKSAAGGALKLVRLPVDLANGARELIAGRLAGADHDDSAGERPPRTAPTPP